MAGSWCLHCIDGSVPCTLQPDGASPSLLKIGRMTQGLELWERLVPKEKYRNTISREHCEIRALPGGVFSIKNISSSGTFINGKVEQGEATATFNDSIGIGSCCNDKGELLPVVTFRLVVSTDQAGAMMKRGSRTFSQAASSFHLECISAAGRSSSSVAALPEAARIIKMTSGSGLLVGRAAQGQQFWEALVFVESERNKVSREHFQLAIEGPVEVALHNKAAAGTLVNSVRIKERTLVRDGDIIGIPHAQRSEEPGEPVAQFRLVLNSGSTGRFDSSSLGPPQGEAIQLSCTSAAGRTTADLAGLPESSRILAVGGHSFKVGRQCQQAFWETLVTDSRARGMISREHFEVRNSGGETLLVNLSGVGTIVNGVRVTSQIALRPGHTVSIPSTPPGGSDGDPVASFEVQPGQGTLVLPPPTGPLAAVGTSSLGLGTMSRQPTTGAAGTSSIGLGAMSRQPTWGPAQAPSAASMIGSLSSRVYDNSNATSPFYLECISAVGLSTVELGFLPKATRIWQPSQGSTSLRIGRTVQSSDVWRVLVPNEQNQNSISREHCEIGSDSGRGAFVLRNLGSMGTSVNDKLVKDTVELQPMDVIGLGMSKEASGGPVLRFRFQLSVGSNLPSIL
mmetsp:Transcript_15845/g.37364  ORF Transcript_15845/g.37364 Transcript_15845/m.37364 type:complete len:624 (+) Transcript_15845:99-1970(+)